MFSSAFLLFGLAVLSQYVLAVQSLKETDKYFETQPAIVNEIPYHIILQNVTSAKYFCGGALLNSLYVLTAAQCVYRRNISEIIVHAGAISLEESYNGTTRLVREIIVHEQYDPQKPWHDIALLRLRRRFVQKLRIKAVSLPLIQSTREDPIDVATITGYGITSEDQEPSFPVLTIHYTRVFPRKVCKYMYSKIRYNISETQICAVDLFISEQDSVSDTGGPLIINETIAGIASNSVTRFPKWLIYPPTVFTSVSSYSNWIWEKILDRAKPDKY